MLFLFLRIFIIKELNMARITDAYSIIVPAQTPVLTAHTYTEIYGGSAGCSIVVNGVAVSVGASSSLPILVRTISGGTGCFLLGENNDVFTGSPNL
jgi:hypothetical protein